MQEFDTCINPISVQIDPNSEQSWFCRRTDGVGQVAQRELLRRPHVEQDAGALREQALARVVLNATRDSDMKALATMVDIMRPIAAELGITFPERPTAIELAAIEAVVALPPAALELYFLCRQRAMHAWDITVFDDYLAAASNERLKQYVAATRAPLREHADWVNRVARKKGIEGGLTVIGSGAR